MFLLVPCQALRSSQYLRERGPYDVVSDDTSAERVSVQCTIVVLVQLVVDEAVCTRAFAMSFLALLTAGRGRALLTTAFINRVNVVHGGGNEVKVEYRVVWVVLDCRGSGVV